MGPQRITWNGEVFVPLASWRARGDERSPFLWPHVGVIAFTFPSLVVSSLHLIVALALLALIAALDLLALTTLDLDLLASRVDREAPAPFDVGPIRHP
jgi:hypothetical protein